jgi:hypothetical protein
MNGGDGVSQVTTMRRLAGRVRHAEKDEPSAGGKNQMLVTARVNEPPVFGEACMGRGTGFGSRLRPHVYPAPLL